MSSFNIKSSKNNNNNDIIVRNEKIESPRDWIKYQIISLNISNVVLLVVFIILTQNVQNDINNQTNLNNNSSQLIGGMQSMLTLANNQASQLKSTIGQTNSLISQAQSFNNQLNSLSLNNISSILSNLHGKQNSRLYSCISNIEPSNFVPTNGGVYLDLNCDIIERTFETINSGVGTQQQSGSNYINAWDIKITNQTTSQIITESVGSYCSNQWGFVWNLNEAGDWVTNVQPVIPNPNGASSSSFRGSSYIKILGPNNYISYSLGNGCSSMILSFKLTIIEYYFD
jgi:hypothetical protein